MKILHTADWHLGQVFYEYDRRAEHLHFLKWLKKQIRQWETDVLLIAGDVFDGLTRRPNRNGCITASCAR